MPGNRNESQVKDGPADWWLLHPLTGLSISDEKLDLDQPLFGDATIISKSHANDVIEEMDFGAGDNATSSRAQIRNLVSYAALKTDFHSFVAVRRSEPFPGNADNSHSNHQNLVEAARSRVQEISACISLSMLARSKTWSTCGLSERVSNQVRAIVAVAPPSGFAYQIASDASTYTINNNVARMSRADVVRMLQHESLAPFTSQLLSQNATLSRSLARSITESAVRLSHAVHSRDRAEQILGAVTALEILVSNFGEPFSRTKHRVCQLVGSTAFTDFRGEDVFRARNHYVHRGQEPKVRELAEFSIALALHALLAYSSLARAIHFREQLLNHLDFLSAGDRARGMFTTDEDSAFKAFSRHEPAQITFPFFETTVRSSRTLNGDS